MKKDEPAETPDNRPAAPKEHYSGLQGKIVAWAGHRFEEGMLLLRVRFMDETELCWTIQTATVIAEADLCDWKTGNEKQLKVFTKGESDWE
jgi:hypothetical protein